MVSKNSSPLVALDKKNRYHLSMLENKLPILCSLSLQNEENIVISNKKTSFCLTVLKNHINFQYSLLSCIAGVDLQTSHYRFGIFYDLLSIKFGNRIRVKILLNEANLIDSAIPIFVNANWWEREIWDMFGIFFKNHPELRRILTDYGFEGYPLRKDFPMAGLTDSYYDHFFKKVSITGMELPQDYRPSFHLQPW